MAALVERDLGQSGGGRITQRARVLGNRIILLFNGSDIRLHLDAIEWGPFKSHKAGALLTTENRGVIENGTTRLELANVSGRWDEPRRGWKAEQKIGVLSMPQNKGTTPANSLFRVPAIRQRVEYWRRYSAYVTR